jgi:hypothetical protein
MPGSVILGADRDFSLADVLRSWLSVAPEGDEPFEAKIVIRANQLEFLGLDSHSLTPGKTAWVLYDPDDHSMIAFEAY